MLNRAPVSEVENQRIKHSVTRGKSITTISSLEKEVAITVGIVGPAQLKAGKQDLYEYGKLLIKWYDFYIFRSFFLSMSISFWRSAHTDWADALHWHSCQALPAERLKGVLKLTPGPPPTHLHKAFRYFSAPITAHIPLCNYHSPNQMLSQIKSIALLWKTRNRVWGSARGLHKKLLAEILSWSQEWLLFTNIYYHLLNSHQVPSALYLKYWWEIILLSCLLCAKYCYRFFTCIYM